MKLMYNFLDNISLVELRKMANSKGTRSSGDFHKLSEPSKSINIVPIMEDHSEGNQSLS
jgi:hypothetical protein